MSPAKPLFSDVDDDRGGDAKSLKVVRVSDCRAVSCILSSACASCSLSTGADPERDDNEPRLEPRPRGRMDGGPVEALGEPCEDIMKSVEHAHAGYEERACQRQL